jgi:hypothetical protein
MQHVPVPAVPAATGRLHWPAEADGFTACGLTLVAVQAAAHVEGASGCGS